MIKSTLSSIPTYYMSLLQALGKLKSCHISKGMGRSQGERSQGFQQSFARGVDREIWGGGECILEGVVAEKYGIMEGRWRTRNIRVSYG